ncbi:hypothetical protein [Sphingobacterium lumbrici]|uniref:hypothetical protein n=1 Tax=Sphingobacterium lumbrici TaxID=2559600 RepID=UPI00112AC867|nr:hypothetical protein [Sphingobacterium lumbrici]
MKYIITSLLIGIATLSNVQAQTAAELKAEREQLQTELRSKKNVSREEKLAKLTEKSPKETGMQSIDGLEKTSTGILGTLKSNNDVLAKYKREVTDNGNGEIDVTNYKANLGDYVKLAGSLAEISKQIASGTEQLKGAQADAKSLSPLKAKPALSSVSYSIDALKLAGEEIALQTKLVNNLIATIKSSDNN